MLKCKHLVDSMQVVENASAYSKKSSDIIMMVRQPCKNTGGIKMDINSLSHTKWNCKYHIVFVPKFRRKIA